MKSTDSEIEFVFDPPPSSPIPLQPSAKESDDSHAEPDQEATSPQEVVSFSPGQASAPRCVTDEGGPCPEEVVSPHVAGDSPEGEEIPNDEADDSEEDLENQDEEVEEEEPEDPHGETLAEIRDELAVTATENRRNTRRIFDALKQFGGVLDALSATVNDIHSTARAQTQPEVRADDQLRDIIELADRVDRIAAAFSREPPPGLSWWPPVRRAVEAWRADRERLSDSFAILTTHVRTLLKNAGIERIACEGELFDPSCMCADEAVLDSSVDDHTVLAEILPGWRESASGRVVRPSHVRVSRTR